MHLPVLENLPIIGDSPLTMTELLNYFHSFSTTSVQVTMTELLNYLHSLSTASVQVTMTELLNYLHSLSTAHLFK
jgi:hypothetical protein